MASGSRLSAEELFAQGAVDQAARAWEERVSANPQDAGALAGLGRCALHAGDAAIALPFLERAFALAPSNVALALDVASAYAALGHDDLARALLEPLCRHREAPAHAHYLLGRMLAADGRHGEAVAGYERALALDPSHAQAADALSSTYRAQLVEVPDDPRALMLVQRAGSLSGAGDPHERDAAGPYGQAADRYRRALSNRPADDELIAGLALSLAGQGRFEAALGELDRAVALAPDRSDYRVYRGDLFVRLGRRDAAVAAYGEALALEEDAAVRVTLARVLARMGREAEALGHYKRAAALKPDLSAAHLGLAVLLARAGHLADAARAIHRFRELAPQDVRGIVEQIEILTEQNRAQQALGIGRSQLKRHHTEPRILVATAIAAMKLRNFEEARGLLDRALEAEPEYPAALVNRGVLARREGDLDLAIRYWQRAVAADGACAEALFDLGCALMLRQEMQAATSLFERAAAADPGMADAHYQRGVCLEALGRTQEAGRAFQEAHHVTAPERPGRREPSRERLAELTEEYRRLLATEPDSRQALQILLEMWSVHMERGEIEQARHALAGAHHVAASSAEVHAAQGATEMRAGRLDLARRAFEAARTLDRNHLPARLGLALVRADLDRQPAEALADVRALAASYSTSAELAYDQGILEAQLGQPEAAIASFTRAIALDPEMHEAWIARGIAAASLHEPARALADFEWACEIAPGSVLAWVNRGAMLIALDRPVEAHHACEQALTLDREHPAALFNAGVARDACGDREGAEASYRRAIAAGADPDAALNLAEILDRSGRRGEARKVLAAVARKHPEAWEARSGASRLAREQGDVASAMDSTQDAMNRHPDQPDVVFARALALDAAGRGAEARELVDAFARAHADEAPAEFVRGRVLAQLSDWDGAIPALARAITRDPGLTEAYGPLAKALASVGRHDEARAAASELVRREPASAASYLALAFVCEHAQDKIGRERALATAWNLDPHDGRVALALARRRLERGRYAEVLDILDRFLTAPDAEPSVFGTAAQAAFRLGRFQRAAELYDAAYHRGGPAMPYVVDQAIALARSGLFDRALPLLSNPELANVAAAHALAGRWLAAADPRAAEERLARAIALAGDAPKERLLAASLALERGAAPAAAALLDHPSLDGDPRALFQRGLAADRTGALERARDLFTQAARSGVADALPNLALVCRQLRDHAGEMDALAAAREAGLDPSALALLEAQAHALRGRPRRALAALAEADPADPIVLALSGSLLALTGQSAAALPVLASALAAAPGDPDLEQNLAFASLYAGQVEPAWQRTAAVRAGPRAGDWLVRACLAELAESPGRARALLEECLATPIADGGLASDGTPDHLDRDRFVIWVARGNVLAVRSPEEALGAYFHALALLPGPPPRYLLTNLGRLLAGRAAMPLQTIGALARVIPDRRALAIAARAAAGAGAPLIDNVRMLWLLRSEIGLRFPSAWLLP